MITNYFLTSICIIKPAEIDLQQKNELFPFSSIVRHKLHGNDYII